MKTPWRRSKKLSCPRGGSPGEACAQHPDRGVVPGRDAGGPEEQAHLSLGQEGLTTPRYSRSTHPVHLSVKFALPPKPTASTPTRPAIALTPKAVGLSHLARVA